LQDRIDLAVVEEMERSIARGDREHATTAFLRRLVKLPASEVEMMRSRPSWPTLVASIDAQPRQARALAGYRFDAKRMSTLHVPTLLVTGAETASASSTPLSFIRKLLMIDGSGWCGDNTSVLLFNMIKAGSLPTTEPGAYEHIA